MNCSTAQNRILNCSDPASPGKSVSAHLEGCAACRTWHTVVKSVELAIIAIPVPASKGKAKRRTIDQFRTVLAEPVHATDLADFQTPFGTAASTSPARERRPLGERLAKLWPAGLVAAAVLIGVSAIEFRRGIVPGPDIEIAADPLLKSAVASKVRLDKAKSAADRMTVLADLADDLHAEASAISMVSPGAEMASLARLYETVVADALVVQARDLAADPTVANKRAVLTTFIDRLSKTEGAANRRAAEAPVGSEEPLTLIARAASSGREKIAKLRENAS